MNKKLIKNLEYLLDCKIIGHAMLGGGSINNAYKLQTSQGLFFIKTNSAKLYPEMFEKEANGLKFLAGSNSIKTPGIVAYGTVDGTSYLVLEYIEKGSPCKDFWEKFGCQLAALHQNTQQYFGFAEDNYIGSLKQINTRKTTWVDFFIECRLIPQIELAKDIMPFAIIKKFHALFKRLPCLFPAEQPSLLHGDLWSGNFLTDKNGFPVLIDPAVYFGYREMDLAMSKLFGGFEKSFYNSYNEAFQMEKGWEERLELCNLYPLMVHVNLFGGSYLLSVEQILNKYL